ncbi:hypothetical protein [Flavobacterium hibisci]|uniref:hypothetical protein n=1 Tax=Flavobacterium hibisci TaxID=1914462 RepID=UPI001CBE07F0|nr:hypothetical protein [Flavobacterium hibisci]MBZ4042638.1 hypothetical protein [Flavobacterium hibisci]
MRTNYFLKQSAKKVIFLIIIIPILIQLILINLAQVIFDKMLLYYIIFVFFWMLYLPYFYWLNISVTFLYNHSNEHFNLKLTNFKISLLVNVITILNFVFFVAYIFSFLNGGRPNIDFVSFMILIQFVAIVSFIYNSYFICKLISTIELNRKVSFRDFNSNFVAFSFPPLAISIIQNKIKKMQIK